jgi:hypothetical protein
MQDINKTDKQIEAFFIDKRKEYSKKYYDKNKELILAKNKKWREANPQREKSRKADWYVQNKNHVAETQKNYMDKVGNELRREKYNNLKTTDPTAYQKKLAYQKEWRDANKQKVVEYRNKHQRKVTNE